MRQLLDSTGQPLVGQQYDPWGMATGGVTPDAFGFTGEWQDRTSGLVNLRARWYQPGAGRFLTRDPFEGVDKLPQSLHSYAYTHNDPVNYADPTGMYRCDIHGYGKLEAYYDYCREQYQRLDDLQANGFIGSMTALDALVYYFTADILPGGNAARRRGHRLQDLTAAAERLDFVLWYKGGGFRNSEYRLGNDSGFGKDFQDGGTWPGSSRQVGHFLTAVNLAYSDDMILDVDALRCIIGHELIGDGNEAEQCLQVVVFNRRALDLFRDAINADQAGNRELRECLLRSIDPTMPGLPGLGATPGREGNSMQDLRLSLKGWIFGKKVQEGTIESTNVAAGWLRTNLGSP